MVSHYNIRRVDRHLRRGRRTAIWARSARDIAAHRRRQPQAPAARQLHHRARPDRDHAQPPITGLLGGLAFAIVLVYLLIVVNFQSWLDPFIIITALPARWRESCCSCSSPARRLSVPALMGAIMCMGVATANSILVVSFAKERLAQHGDAAGAAIEAGFTRFRPVLMTALAMIIGMVPMALGLGEGGEQNAPLGRAVIGGLMWRPSRHCSSSRVVFTSARHARGKKTSAARQTRPPADQRTTAGAPSRPSPRD